MANIGKTLKAIEDDVENVYNTADKEIREKWDAYMNKIGKKVNDLYSQYEQAVKAGDSKLANELLYEYQRNVQNMTLQDSRYRAMVRETSEQIAHVNDTAIGVINGQMGQVYTLAYNELAKDINGANLGGYSFTLVDQRTIDALIANNGSLLPDPSKKTLAEILQKSLDYGKDMRWNTKAMNSQLLQGVLQGEPIGKIAARLQNVIDMNRSSAIRNARTMTTNARNKGKDDSLRKAANDGVILKRVWQCTHDERTRIAHWEADGQERDVDEPFDIDGYQLMYPGDRSGPPELVYNCRCMLGTRIIGFQNESDRNLYDNVPDLDEDSAKKYGKSTTDNEIKYNELDKTLRKDFERGLNNADQDVRKVLEGVYKDATYCTEEFKSKLFVNPQTGNRVININTEKPGTLAHELFHLEDVGNGGYLSNGISTFLGNDLQRLKEMAMPGESISSMLMREYPDAFTGKGNKMKEEYSGIADILKGLTGESYGYGHDFEYYKGGKLEKEAVAQFGRVFYDNKQGPTEMFMDVFGETGSVLFSRIAR